MAEDKAAAEKAEDTAQKDWQSTESDSSEQDDQGDDEYGVSLDKVQAVLDANIDQSTLSPQMRRMVRRQQENTRRVEETIKGTKANPSWYVPLFVGLMLIGLLWAVVYYLTSDYPIPNIGAWNLAIAFSILMVGFLMTMAWR